jgi:glycerol-3-phosphate O-acyltransferase
VPLLVNVSAEIRCADNSAWFLHQVSNTSTHIPVEIINSLITTVIDDMCAANATARHVSAAEHHEMLKEELRQKRLRLLNRKPSSRNMTMRLDQRQRREAHARWLKELGVTPLETFEVPTTKDAKIIL